MSDVFAKIFALLTALERDYGIALLEKDERVIFDFIVLAVAEGQCITIGDVVSARLTSRSSTYRHISSLKDAGLIFEVVKDGRAIINLNPKLNQFKRSLDQVTRKICRIS